MAVPTQARALAYFNYDSQTGALSVKERPRTDFTTRCTYVRHKNLVGRTVGSPNKQGYIKVCIDGHYHSAHRIAWLMVHGEWVKYPDFEIDHINGDPADNRLANLRRVTKSKNQRNGGKRANNTSGVHGVNWKPKYNSKPGDGYWVARIWNGPRHVYLGSFKDIQHAQIARRAAERVLGFTDVEARGDG